MFHAVFPIVTFGQPYTVFRSVNIILEFLLQYTSFAIYTILIIKILENIIWCILTNRYSLRHDIKL